jgi:hypothetical protein
MIIPGLGEIGIIAMRGANACEHHLASAAQLAMLRPWSLRAK